jgi:serine acetyltransferase
MLSVVIYATGSPILVDVEESAHRAGLRIAAGVRNVAGDSFLSESIPLHAPDTLPSHLTSLPFIVPLFTPGNRQAAMREATACGFTQAHTLVDPTVALPRGLTLKAGIYINAGVSLGNSSYFDEFVFVNRGVTIGHHVRLGRFVSIGPGAVISGQVTIGRGAMVGAGAVVLPAITIGDNAVVAAGSVVTKDIPQACLAAGNPVQIVKQAIGGHKGLAVT